MRKKDGAYTFFLLMRMFRVFLFENLIKVMTKGDGVAGRRITHAMSFGLYQFPPCLYAIFEIQVAIQLCYLVLCTGHCFKEKNTNIMNWTLIFSLII